MTKTIIITGANGFIGESLVSYFHVLGWKVRALVHNSPKNKLPDVDYFPYDMEDCPLESVFEGADFLVHCAYLRHDRNRNSNTININGTRDLIALCRKQNIKPVFLSSFSAHPAAASHYGKTKFESEKLFDLSRDLVLKSGFVIGKKGMGAEIVNKIKSSKWFPLVGGGLQPIQTIAIDDLCLIINGVLDKDASGLFHIAEAEAITMKSFYEEIALQLNRKIVFIPMPTSFMYAICRFAETVGLKLPVSSESVLGLKHLIKFDTRKDLAKLQVSLKTYRESIQSALK
ncbi:MAG TPA: NAD-dependent epimerase/dehydratase family protein [Bacteroidia bacterium]|jgi:nucleoside-diphosphate-sugar epimerase